MSYHTKRRRRGVLGDAVTDAIASGSGGGSSTISGGTPSVPMLPGVLTAGGLAQIKASGPLAQVISGSRPPSATQAIQQAAAAGAAAQAACSSFTDPLANRFCIESAQKLSGQALIDNVQAKLACENVIQSGALTDDQRQDCVMSAMKQQQTGGLNPSKLAQATVDFEAQKAYAIGVAQQTFFAKHKVAIFAVGGVAVSALLMTAILRRKHQPTPNRRRRLVVGSSA